MEKIDRLMEMTEYVQADDLTAQLRHLRETAAADRAELIFPLVGEFSAGKTSLINALTDSCALETATQPTTATLYTIHFGCDECHASITGSDGTVTDVNDIGALRNADLADAAFVSISDTSTKVPADTIIVDTPGLSSADTSHRLALANIMPQADGLILVADVNQQVTRSLLDFVGMMKMAERPIYLVITKTDTKPAQEVEAAKRYLAGNCDLPLERVAAVSAREGRLEELYTIINDIQQNKRRIIAETCRRRTGIIADELRKRITQLIRSAESDTSLDEKITRLRQQNKSLSRYIEQTVDHAEEGIAEIKTGYCRRFEDELSGKLDCLVRTPQEDFDAEAVALINGTASLMLRSFRHDVAGIMRRTLLEGQTEPDWPDFSAAADPDIADEGLALDYSISLNDAGHEYDRTLSNMTKIAAAVGLVAVAFPVGGAAAGSATGTAVGTASKVGTVISAADTVTDIGSMVVMKRQARKMQRAIRWVKRVDEAKQHLDTADRNYAEERKLNKGLVESMVGWATERTMGKPQRLKTIHAYMDNTLLPQFRRRMDELGTTTVERISRTMRRIADERFGQMNDAMRGLQIRKKQQEESYREKISRLQAYENALAAM